MGSEMCIRDSSGNSSCFFTCEWEVGFDDASLRFFGEFDPSAEDVEAIDLEAHAFDFPFLPPSVCMVGFDGFAAGFFGEFDSSSDDAEACGFCFF